MLSKRTLENLEPQAQIELGFTAAGLALRFWLRANPEKIYQQPLIEALAAVEVYCRTGVVMPEVKGLAEKAYKTVNGCDLPAGDVHRAAGFSVAHIAMAPWLLEAGRRSNAQHNAMVAINYSESIHRWAGQQVEFEANLASRRESILAARKGPPGR